MDFSSLRAVMDDIVSWRIPGCDISVEKDGENVFRYQAGYSDIDAKIPVSPDALYYIFSATKPITAAAAVRLMEEGKLSPDDEVGKYISSFNDIKVHLKKDDGMVDIVPVKRSVKVIDLLTMTAGLDYDLHKPAIEDVKIRTENRAPTVEIAEAIGRDGLIFQPDEKFNYSLCLDVIGAVIEVASGEKFGDFVKSRIFEPLGMENTKFSLTEEEKKNIVPLYSYNRDTGKAEKYLYGNRYILGSEYESGGAGLSSTVDDYMKFCSMLSNMGKTYSGKRIISEEYIDLMRKNHLEGNALQDFRSAWYYLKGYGYGFGVRTAMDASLADKYMSVGEFGWCGAAGAMVLADPKNHLAVYYAQHMLNNQEWIVHPRLKEALYKDLGF